MNRCLLLALVCVLPICAAAQLTDPLPVTQVPHMQGVRTFPAKALRGKLQVLQARDVLIDGKPEQISPGARIRDTANRLITPAHLVGGEWVVNFVRESHGLIHEVWLLTPDETHQKIAANTPERNFLFASEVDTRKTDDGKTPFHQLPSYQELGRQQRQPR